MVITDGVWQWQFLLFLFLIKSDDKARRSYGPKSISEICIVNLATKETKELSIQDWILMGIYIVNLGVQHQRTPWYNIL